MRKIVMDWLRGRLRERTTYAGLALWLITVGGIDKGFISSLEAMLTGLGGMALVAIAPEKLLPGNDKLKSPLWVGILALALLLGGCGAMGMNKQQYAGLNWVHVQTGGGCAEADKLNQDGCSVKMVDGKEGDIYVKVILADGTTYEYKAGVTAFKGQAIRAGVDKEAVKAVTGIVKDVIDAVKPKLPE